MRQKRLQLHQLLVLRFAVGTLLLLRFLRVRSRLREKERREASEKDARRQRERRAGVKREERSVCIERKARSFVLSADKWDNSSDNASSFPKAKIGDLKEEASKLKQPKPFCLKENEDFPT